MAKCRANGDTAPAQPFYARIGGTLICRLDACARKAGVTLPRYPAGHRSTQPLQHVGIRTHDVRLGRVPPAGHDAIRGTGTGAAEGRPSRRTPGAWARMMRTPSKAATVRLILHPSGAIPSYACPNPLI